MNPISTVRTVLISQKAETAKVVESMNGIGIGTVKRFLAVHEIVVQVLKESIAEFGLKERSLMALSGIDTGMSLICIGCFSCGWFS